MTATQGCGGEGLRVLLIGLNYAPESTGIAPYTTGFARYLAARGTQVTALTGYPHYPQWALHAGYEKPRAPEDDQGVRLRRLRHPVPRRPTGPARIWMETVFAWRAMLRLLCSRTDVVVVVSPALLSLVPAVLLRRLLGYRVGAVVQDLYGAAVAETGIGGGLLTRLTLLLERQLLRRVDGIVVIHDVFKQKLLAAGIPARRIEVVPNWTHVTMHDEHDRRSTRRALGWREGEFIALHAGNMGAKQGLEGLIDVGRLAEQRGSPVRVVLLGDGSRRAALSAHAAGVPTVSFMDSLPDGVFVDALRAADCLVLHEKPGVVEMSVPSKLTTYFASGRPVVAATDPRSGAASLMVDSNAGITVRAGDAGAILDAIEQLVNDEEAARRFGLNGRRYAAAHMTESESLRRLQAWTHSLAMLGPRAVREVDEASA